MTPSGLRRVGLVTVDVEPDNVWADTHSRSFENIRQLPRFHRICREHDVRPTYLVTSSAAEDPVSAQVLESLLAQGDCEIGAHSHLWEVPPLVSQDRTGRACVGSDYPSAPLSEKLGRLIEVLRQRFGAPRSHRAGRFGLDPRQASILEAVGIVADTSITPGLDWSSVGAPDYSRAPLQPYFLGHGDLVTPGHSKLLEIPCTIRPGRILGSLVKGRLINAMMRRLGLGPVWLRCSPSVAIERLLDVCQWAIQQTPQLNLMTHSSELCAGTSPYWKTEQSVQTHLANCAVIFGWWRQHGVTPLTVSEAARSWVLQVQG